MDKKPPVIKAGGFFQRYFHIKWHMDTIFLTYYQVGNSLSIVVPISAVNCCLHVVCCLKFKLGNVKRVYTFFQNVLHSFLSSILKRMILARRA